VTAPALPPELHDLVLPGIGDGGSDVKPAPKPVAAARRSVGPSRASRERSGDAFASYIRSLHASTVLPAEEEHRLAIAYRDHGDRHAAARLVSANLRLVVKIAEEYGRASDHLLDLIQEGNLGLFHAVQRFDPDRGVKLSSYAAWWIRAYILKFLLTNCRVVRLGTTLAQRKLFYKLRSERERLQNSGIDDVQPHHLAESLNVKESEVREMELRLASPDTSLDAPLRGDDTESGTLSNFVQADAASRPDVRVEEDEYQRRLKQTFAKFQAGLSERERRIFEERLLSDEPVTLQEIGKRYGVSRERARQLEVRLKKKVRQFLATELGDAKADEEAVAA
jgi:RNA polymerase sigma-32 factor